MSDKLCACGALTHKHGYRQISVSDFDNLTQKIVEVDVDVTRYLCRSCGQSLSFESTEIEPGFRMSKACADILVETAVALGVGETAKRFLMDKSVVSRLLSSRSGRKLQSLDFKGLTGLRSIRPNLVEAYDYLTGAPKAYFSGVHDENLKKIIGGDSRVHVAPDVELLPFVAKWLGKDKIVMSAVVFSGFMEKLMGKAARKMAKHLCRFELPENKLEQLLCKSARELDREEQADFARLNAPGSPARKFFDMKSRITNLYRTHDLRIAKKRLDSWLADCVGAWADIFSPVVDFLNTWKPAILQHPYSLNVPSLSNVRMANMPASVLTLRLQRPISPKAEKKLTRDFRSEPKLAFRPS